jgi:hypothetical protein
LAFVLAPGCDGGTRLEGDRDGADVRDGADAADAGDDGDARDDAASPDDGTDAGDGGEVDPCGPDSCPNDPPDGPVGRPCVLNEDCGVSGLYCMQESTDSYDGAAYVSFAGGYCAAFGYGASVCEPRVSGSCPEGSLCVPFGADRTGRAMSGCFDECAASSSLGEPWTTNCDCREGYQCSRQGEICLPGCTHDRECCEIWEDRNRDGGRDPGEVTLLGPDRCADACDRCTWTCTRRGCPGGACRVGDPCAHDADCPPLGTCIAERPADGSFSGGMCMQDRCDLIDRECPAGSGCGNLGGMFYAYRVCVVPCEAGSGPGDPGFGCRDVDPPGPSPGDYACRPADERFWFDGAGDTGYCWAGNFPGGAVPIGGPCMESDACASPNGVGFCLDLPGVPGFCSAACNATTAAAGHCEIDPPAAEATGMCLFGFCVEACDVPSGPLGESGCADPTMACYASVGFRAFLSTTEGKDLPPGFCWPSCLTDAGCRDMWNEDAMRCDRPSGVCLR